MTKTMTDLCNRAASDTSLHDLVVGWLRYEALRLATPAQFADLIERNVKGENFDGMVDGLVEARAGAPDAEGESRAASARTLHPLVGDSES